MQFDAFSLTENEQYPDLIGLIEQTCQEFAANPAYICLDQRYSFADIEQQSRYFAAYLQQHTELKVGDRIAIQLPNLVQYVIAAYGALRAGLVLVNTNPLYTERELVHQYQDSGAKALVVLSDLLPVIAKVVPQTQIEYVISTHVFDLIERQIHPQTGLQHIEFCDVLALGAQTQYERPNIADNALAALQYTGGTTGLAKGAMLTHTNLIANTLQCQSRLSQSLDTGKEVIIAPLPVYHIYAFTVNLLLYFKMGCCSILIPNPRDLNQFVEAISPHKFTGMIGLNTLFIGLCHHPQFKQLDFSQFKLTISGGTTLTQTAADLWLTTTGCTISEGYGLSETSPVVSINLPGHERLGTIGKPLVDTLVKLLDEQGQTITGTEAELAIKGPQVMLGYWNNPQETEDAMTADGYFKTGDIASISDDGFITIVDRKKDVILVSGFNVYPNEVENILAMHPQVLESAVVACANEHSGEIVKAIIVCKTEITDEQQLSDDIRQHCREQLAAYKVPKVIKFVEQLPKSTVGKILRRELRQA
ncbi:AMP-binding protein [Shewanella marina]|uniref:AMP-binding protein n=1 Tax=Shewanella marina TaxID=487319 RepID=UPI000472EEB6|nr:AMP-binding protein [Shewanella marina]